MHDLLGEIVTETNESLGVVDVELVRFEQDPNNAKILDNIFRLVHTIKGTCGFLGLPRLEALAHAAESMIGHFREGAPVTSDAVTLTLETIDRIKAIIKALEETAAEPDGDDLDLIRKLEDQVEGGPADAVLPAAVDLPGQSPARTGEELEAAALDLIASLAPTLPAQLQAIVSPAPQADKADPP